MLRTTLLLTLAVSALAGALLFPSRARADEVVDAKRATLDAILLDKDDTIDRAKAVRDLAKVGSPAAATAFVEMLDKLAERKAELEKRRRRTAQEYEPFEGFSFKDPKAWDTKKRLRKALDDQDETLQNDSVVLRAFAKAASGFVDATANKTLIRSAAGSPRVHTRRALFSGLLRNATIDALEVGKKAMRDKDPTVRLVALEALEERKALETMPIAIKALKESGWPHRQAAARLLQAIGDINAVVPLLNAMAVDEGRMLEVYAEALRELTRTEIGPFPDAWKAWYDENKDDLVAKGAAGGSVRRAKAKAAEAINYYGIETISKRIVFLIDVSGSMNEPINDMPTDVTGEDEEVYRGLKIAIAKKMLKQAIRNLPEESFFNIVIFNHEIKTFADSAQQATQGNKNKAYLAINDLEAVGATFTYGALEKTFAMAGRGVSDKAYDPGVDTIFVLSDGAPTDSDDTSAKPMDIEKILGAVQEWNQLNRIVIHTIAIDPRIGKGGKGFVRFMKKLAHQNKGTYTEVGGDTKK
jgi:HEAT repeat protein/uncharacterized protein YegL